MTQARAVDLIVPGPLDLLTGGYLYDRRIMAGLADRGWITTLHAVDPGFPEPDAAALEAAGRLLDSLPDGRRVVIDGLALSGLLPLLDAAVRRLRVVALIHHPLAMETGLDAETAARLRARERAALAAVGTVVVTSPWTRRVLEDYEVQPDRVRVVLPGVDRPAPGPARTPDATVRLLTVGTVTPRKGHAVLIEALGGLVDQDWTLRCIGSLTLDPAEARDLRRRISAAGLDDRVALLGEQPPDVVAAEYPQADLFVLASHLEGYGMVVAEAVANGLPVVATDSGAVAETLPAGAGQLVPAGNPGALREALQRLMRDRAALRRFRAGALAAAADIPTWSRSAEQFDTVLSEAFR